MTPQIDHLKDSPLEFVRSMLATDKILLTPMQEKLLEEIKSGNTKLAHRMGHSPHRHRFHNDLVCVMGYAFKTMENK